MNTTYSTRVQAPNSNHVEDQQPDDLSVLKPSLGGTGDDELVTQRQQRENIYTKNQKIKKKVSSKGVVSCSRETFIGSLNVRTARENFKRLELA